MLCSEDCIRYAEECTELCASVPRELHAALLEIAETWLDLADRCQHQNQDQDLADEPSTRTPPVTRH
jgi:hypothetical protein